MAANICDVPELVELGGKLKVDAVRIQMLANTYSYKPEVGARLADITIRGKAVQEHLHSAQQRARELGITFEAEKGKQSSLENKCPWPFSRTFISAEGLVVPCGTIADPRTINFGSLLEKSFKEIWENEAYKAFRAQHTNYDIPACCRNCYGLSAAT